MNIAIRIALQQNTSAQGTYKARILQQQQQQQAKTRRMAVSSALLKASYLSP